MSNDSNWQSTDSHYLLTAIALFMIVIGVALIAITTLLPFSLVNGDVFTWQYLLARLDLSLLSDDSWTDVPRNILLFIPLGMGISALMFSLGKSEQQTIIVVLLLGAGMTILVETIQVFLTARSPELSDIIANTVGVLLGHFIIRRMHNSMHLWFDAGGLLLSAHNLQRLLLGSVGLAVLMIIALMYLSTQAGLSNWDTSYHFAIGNELTGDRPWHGSVDEIIILARAATPEEIADYLGETTIPAFGELEPVAHYCLACPEPLGEISGLSPDLVERVTTAPSAEPAQESAWLETVAPASALNQNLAASSEFTIFAVLTSLAVKQTGPARIATLSQDTLNRNLTVGQEDADLVLRLRTPTTGLNGTRPEIRTPNVFHDQGPHRIVIAYAAPKLRIFVDTPDEMSEVALAPGIALMRYLIPNSVWRLSLRTTDIAAYRIVFYGFVFTPLLIIVFLTFKWIDRIQPMGSTVIREKKKATRESQRETHHEI